MNTKQKALREWLKQMGVDETYAKNPINHTIANSNNTLIASSPPTNSPKATANSSSQDIANKATTLKELQLAVEQFDGCAIKKLALHTVFADGNPEADIMLIGEAPGASEDKYGIPFCGQSGKLLDRVLLSIGLTRKEVYITNTIFWRPPGNRRPTLEELNACRPFVEKHIFFIKPKIIILVGSTAVESLLDSKVSMHNLRSGLYNYTNQYLSAPIKTYVIFHPSYLLRQPAKKKLMWYDMLKIKGYLQQAQD